MVNINEPIVLAIDPRPAFIRRERKEFERRAAAGLITGGAASFDGPPSFRAITDRAAREAAARREAEISSFRGQVSFIGDERGRLEREQASIEAEGRRIESLRSNIERRQGSLITRGTVATNRLVLEFNKKSATLNQKAEAFGKKVDTFNVKVSQSNIRAGELNVQPVATPFVKEFVAPREITPGLPAFGLEARQTRVEIQRRQEEFRAFRERPTPKPFGLEPITDFPKFVEERTAAIRKKGQELFEMAAFEQATFFKPRPDILERKVKGIKKRAKVGLIGLEIGTGAAGLGFVALGEPFIGALPKTPVKFVDPFGVERELTPGGFRSALGLSGELAFVSAVFKAPGAVRAIPKAITATRLEFAGLKQPGLISLGQRGELVIFEKKGPKIKLKKISKAEARELRKQGIILGKPGELAFEPLPPVKITPAEAKRLRELGVLVKPTAPAEFVTPEPSPGIIPRGPKVKIPELGKFLDPGRPLTFEEEQLLKSLRPLKAISRKLIKAPKPFFAVEPTPGVIPRGPKVKIPELGKFLDPARPLTFEEKALERAFAFQLKPTKPFFKPLAIKPLPKIAPPTTAALRQAPQLSFKEFAKQLKAVEVFGKPLPAQRFLGIPGSAKALAFGLPLRPKGKMVEEIDFFGTRLKLRELPSLGKELEFLKIKTKPLEIQRQKISQISAFKTLQLPKLRGVTKVQPIFSQKELQLIIPRVAIVEAQAKRVKFSELQRFRPRLKQITLTRQRQIFRQPTPPKEVFKK
ncbi:hypothetical protein LCGC14_1876500, partial [marine sediment metagenome]